MESFWNDLEKELGITVILSDRTKILSLGVAEFIQRDIRSWKINGKNYTNNPEAFRRALLMDTALKYFKRGDHASTTESKS